MKDYKYIIMCGGNYVKWDTPRHLLKVNDEVIVERTIRLLRENGVSDIAITTNSDKFDYLDVEIIHNKNNFKEYAYNEYDGYWCECFYITDTPVCYIFGDVYFSDNAIKKIVETNTDDIEFFASAPPFADNYVKPWAEPFALKVANTKHLKESITKCVELDRKGKFKRKPIMWELWQVIKNHELNFIDYSSYTAINDYTCDVDDISDVQKIEKAVNKTPYYVIHACLEREWYVLEYLIPSMVNQGIPRENIKVCTDRHKRGNLQHCMNIFEDLPKNGCTWHLQDDILISSKFKEVTQQYNDFDGIICGISIRHDIEDEEEYWNKACTGLEHLWWSFPCMKIPNNIARDTAFFYNKVPDSTVDFWKSHRKGDDSVFRLFLQKYHPLIEYINLVPNIVAHIDYLLGGSLVNNQRKYQLEATHFEEHELIDELAKKLSRRKGTT